VQPQSCELLQAIRKEAKMGAEKAAQEKATVAAYESGKKNSKFTIVISNQIYDLNDINRIKSFKSSFRVLNKQGLKQLLNGSSVFWGCL
jgi:hypothetical protein